MASPVAGSTPRKCRRLEGAQRLADLDPVDAPDAAVERLVVEQAR